MYKLHCAYMYVVGQEDKRTDNRTMVPAQKTNATAGCLRGPVKTELLN